MATLLDDSISISADAYGAEPLTAAEIDAHPDRARIWATINMLRVYSGRVTEKAFDDGFADGRGHAE